MIISAHQPAYLPWLGYVHKLACSDIFVVMDDVQFEKNSYCNRNRILQNGNEVMLTIPLSMKGHMGKTISDMKTANNHWQKKHYKSVCLAYGKAPYFENFRLFFQEMYGLKSNIFTDYCDLCLKMILDYTGINTRIIKASELNIASRKDAYVIELSQKLKGSVFIFGAQGRSYANTQKMKKYGISPFFQDYVHPIYSQLSKKFHPYITVFDLFFNEPRSRVLDLIMENNPYKSDVRALATETRKGRRKL